MSVAKAALVGKMCDEYSQPGLCKAFDKMVNTDLQETIDVSSDEGPDEEEEAGPSTKADIGIASSTKPASKKPAAKPKTQQGEDKTGIPVTKMPPTARESW